MKKVTLFFVILFLFSFPFIVYADEYSVGQLIPVDSVATVKTEKFDYNNFVFHSTADESGNQYIEFQSIQNNTLSKVAVSINLLLFDQEKRNIGLVSYCSNKDSDSKYDGFKLVGKQAASFSISVGKQYYVSSKVGTDVRFVAVLDENRYCKVGGYSSYDGLTIEEILNIDSKQSNLIKDMIQKIQDNGLQYIFLNGLVILTVLVVSGIFLNVLHQRMYRKATFLAYLPVADVYICLKMAFGKIVSVILLLFCLVSLVLAYFKFPFLLILAGVIVVVALGINLIKLITKKYSLFAFEPSIEVPVVKDSKKTMDETIVSDTEEVHEPILDLSYSDSDLSNVQGSMPSILNVDSVPPVEENKPEETFVPLPDMSFNTVPTEEKPVVEQEKDASSPDLTLDDDSEEEDLSDFY